MAAAATATIDPFQYTATGVLGDKRDTMLQNQLLLRGELGQPMRRGYSYLPGESSGFRYGRPSGLKDGGAAEALRGWGAGATLPFPKSKGGQDAPKTERDFMALNRAAVQAGLITAPEHYQFRSTHDVRRKLQAEEGKNVKTRRLPPSMVFGISTRPSTPVHDLLEHHYQDQWLAERRSAEMTKRQKENKQRLTPGKVYETRASLLRTHQVPVEPAPLWQLPRFSKSAKPHLETFRTEKIKVDSFGHHQSDGISRRGVFGHGVYEAAKS